MRRTVKMTILAAFMAAAATLVMSGPSYAMSLESAEKVIIKGIQKHAEKLKNMNVGVYNAAKRGPSALSEHCRKHTGDCIGVAIELALIF